MDDLVRLELIRNSGSELNRVIKITQASGHEQNLVLQDVGENLRGLVRIVDEIAKRVLHMQSTASRSSEVSGRCGQQVQETMIRMKNLEDEFHSISRLLKDIEGLSNQTNLLALNATIEAARAGEAGKSFAVVASEVKELSRNTQKSNSQIQLTIGNLFASLSELSESLKSTQQSIEESRNSSLEASTEASTVYGSAQILTKSMDGTQQQLKTIESSLKDSAVRSREVEVIGMTFENMLKHMTYEGLFNTDNDPLKGFEELALQSKFNDGKRFSSKLKEYRLKAGEILISITDSKGRITFANETFCRVAEYNMDELMGAPHNIVRHPDMPASAFKNLWETIQGRKIWQGFVKNSTKSGGYYWVKATVFPCLGANGSLEGFISVRGPAEEKMIARAEACYRKLP